MDAINQPVQSKAGKLSWALKRCTSTEHLWNRKLVSLTVLRNFPTEITQELASWCVEYAECVNGDRFKKYIPSAYFSSLWEAAVSAVAPDSRAAAPIYESASGHVTVTSQDSALPLDQGTSVRPSGRLPSDLNKPEGSLVTGKPAEEKAWAIRSLKAWCLEALIIITDKQNFQKCTINKNHHKGALNLNIKQKRFERVLEEVQWYIK